MVPRLPARRHGDRRAHQGRSGPRPAAWRQHRWGWIAGEDVIEHADRSAGTVAETSLGTVEYIDSGRDSPVLFVHGPPGGCDQGAVMGAFLVPRGFRVIALSRPGYLGMPLTETVKTPDQQADLELALMDSLGGRY